MHQSGFLLWFIDRLISLARMVAVNKLWLVKTESADGCGQATIELLDGEVMRLTLRRDMDWQAGQHAYVPFYRYGDIAYLHCQFLVDAFYRMDQSRATSFQYV